MTSHSLRRKAASGQHILVFSNTFLSCSFKKHCETSLTSKPELLLFFCSVTSTVTKLPLKRSFSPRKWLGTPGWVEADTYKKKLEKNVFPVFCFLIWCSEILPTNEQGSSLSQGMKIRVSCGSIVKHCYWNRGVNEPYSPRAAGCIQANRVLRDISEREILEFLFPFFLLLHLNNKWQVLHECSCTSKIN